MNNLIKKLNEFTPVLLRIGVGVVFTYHGFDKVFGAEAALGTSWNPYGMPAMLQVLVSWGELLGGVALLAGFLTRYAASGIIVIMIGAIVTVHGKNGFNMMNSGYEYNFVLILMCLALLGSGGGPLSVDQKLSNT